MPPDEAAQALPDHSACADPMTTATAEMFLRQRDQYSEAWKARGRELNEIYDALTALVEEPAPGFDPVADLKALGAQRDRLRAENEALKEALANFAVHDEACRFDLPDGWDTETCRVCELLAPAASDEVPQ